MKLVKNKMTTFDWYVRAWLILHAHGLENAQKSIDVASLLGVDKATLRKSLKHIKTYTDTKIGMIDGKLFVVTNFDELVRGMGYSVAKTKSHMETDIMQNPGLAKYYHAKIHEFYQKANKAPQGQMVMQFNGYERDIDYYAERYDKK